MFNTKKQEKLYEEILINTPLEYIAFQIPRKALVFLILATAGVLGSIGLTIINVFIIGQTDLVTLLVQGMQITISLIFLLQSALIYKSVIKRGENIIAREHRGGVMTFDKQSIKKKIFFDNKDPSTEITTLWNGTAIEKQSGAKIIMIKEGSKSNENINLCVSETDWNKNLNSMVRSKTFADLAESDYLNGQTLLGLKWQDIAIILTILLTVGIIIILLGITPDMIAKSVNESLLNGTLQHAIQSVVTPTTTGAVA